MIESDGGVTFLVSRSSGDMKDAVIVHNSFPSSLSGMITFYSLT